MAVSLPVEILNAQDEMERSPLVRIATTELIEAIPFLGNYFTDSTTQETLSSLLSLNDGRIFSIYARGATLIVSFTDIDRNIWSEKAVSVSADSIQGIDIVQLVNGDIGIILTYYEDDEDFQTSGNRLGYLITDTYGNVVTGLTMIEEYPSGTYPKDPTVILFANNTYRMVYSLYNTNLTWEVKSRTSSNFTTWSSESAVLINPLLNTREIGGFDLFQTVSGFLILFFHYASFTKNNNDINVFNIFFMESLDLGNSFDEPIPITAYTKWGMSCINPTAAEKADGRIRLGYTDHRVVLSADSSTPNWDLTCTNFNNNNSTNLHFDPNTRLLYSYAIYFYTGMKSICGIIVIDVDTWEVIRKYDQSTTITFHEIFNEQHVWALTDKGDGQYICFSCDWGVCIIDDYLKVTHEYWFRDFPTEMISRNVSTEGTVKSTYVDASSSKVYVLLGDGTIGYIEINQGADSDSGEFSFILIGQVSFTQVQMMYQPSINLILGINAIGINFWSPLSSHANYEGKFLLIDIHNGSVIKEYTMSSHGDFPYGGLKYHTYCDGCIYGAFPYTTIYNQEYNTGLVRINLNSDQIDYLKPTWDYSQYDGSTNTSNGFKEMLTTSKGVIVIATYATPGGVTTFDTNSEEFTLFTGSTVYGFEPEEDTSGCFSVAFDEREQQIFTGSIDTILTDAFIGVRSFNILGSFDKGRLIIGQNFGDWDWVEDQRLTIENYESDMSIVIDRDDVIWATWVSSDLLQTSAKWGMEQYSMELTDFIAADKPLSISWTLEDTGKLSFTLAEGHLFDPNNLSSVYNTLLKKGKTISILFGESVDGTPYWTNHGEYIVDTIKLSYSRGSYPLISVTCGNKDLMWDNVQVIASERYNTDNPEQMTHLLLMEYTGLENNDIVVNPYPYRHHVNYQWVDTDFKSLLSEILDHFQSAPYFNHEGKFVPKPIKTSGDPDHIYTDTDKIIKFTPDNNYSSYTNLVTVTAEGDYFVGVTYPEELIGTLAGSGGWWEDDIKTIRIYYSKDQTKVCHNPRFVILESIKDFKILWMESGGDEYLSNVAEDNTWCEVTIEFPGLMEVLIALIIAYLALGATAAACGFGVVVDLPCGPFILALSLLGALIYYLLGQVCSYSYEIYGRPVGEEKQTVSGFAEDLNFRAEIGNLVVEDEYSDPLCFNSAMCTQVAEYELKLVQAQRREVSFEKIAHLQDEICDIVQIKHPYSGWDMKVFITELTRTYTRPKKGSSVGGAFIDSIKGWKV